MVLLDMSPSGDCDGPGKGISWPGPQLRGRDVKGANMKKAFSIFLATLIFTGAAAAKDMSPAEKKIVDLETTWSKAFVGKDIKTLSGIIADDWMGQEDSGKPTDKAALIGMVKTGDLTITKMTNRDLHVRIIGTVAIAQGSDDEKSTYKGKDTSGAYTWQDVFEMRGGKWVAIASQVTKVAVSPQK